MCNYMAKPAEIQCLCKWLLISGLVLSLIFIIVFNNPNSRATEFFPVKLREWSGSAEQLQPPTNLSHLVFGLLGSEAAWHQRKDYIQSWWRPKTMRGYVYLDKPPTGDLLPWSKASPPFRVSNNISKLIEETNAVAPIMIRMVHGIKEVFEQENGNLRWLVMGDDDSIFMVDNIVDVLEKYDHEKYYYFGGNSEFILSNYWFSFNQGFGGAGFILSYSLAKVLANDMENCLRRYASVKSADFITMMCIADVGVNLSPHKGIHQIDLHGDISGFLSSHPQAPLISLHHFDAIKPIFPSKDRFESAKHLMKASSLDQSRMLQQTICYLRQNNWSFSISWGYSIHIYEKIMPRSYLQLPIETFQPWVYNAQQPLYMFNTRKLSNNDSCETPHVFYFDSIEKVVSDGRGRGGGGGEDSIRIVYARASPRGLPSCSNQSADVVSKIEVFSPATTRIEDGRCECCDIVHGAGMKTARVKFRKCMTDEIIA